MIKLVISGCCGRMGLRIASLAYQGKKFQIAGAFERAGHPEIGKPLGELLGVGGEQVPVTITDKPEEAIQKGQVVVEFTSPEATLKNLAHAVMRKKAVVIGTTAIGEAGIQEIRNAARHIPIVFSPNMSIGVNLLFTLLRQAAAGLEDYTVSMSEAHHKHKKDAPSGTAKKLAQIVREVRGAIEIPIESIREGEIVGDHSVVFENMFERLTLTHHAKSRDVFAGGALVAAAFVAGKKKGLFTMQDVLGL